MLVSLLVDGLNKNCILTLTRLQHSGQFTNQRAWVDLYYSVRGLTYISLFTPQAARRFLKRSSCDGQVFRPGGAQTPDSRMTSMMF